MKTTVRLSLSVVVALLVGCNGSPAPAPSPGDLAPRVTYQAPARAAQRRLVQVSTPQSPKEVFTPRIDLPVVTEHDAVLKIPAGAPGTYTVPVDAVSPDSFLYLVVHSNDPDVVQAVLQDITVTSPAGEVLNRRAPVKMAVGDPNAPEQPPMPTVPLEGKPTGDYAIQVGPTAAKLDLTVEVQQPLSDIELRLQASTPELLLGNDGSADVTLTAGGKPIQAAHVVGHLVDPSMRRTLDLTFTPQGHGVWRASGLGAAFDRASAPGVWHVFVEADGATASGQPFRRSASTGFDFAVPTARIADASTTRIVRDASGRITAFEVDVTLESKATDRYEVSAMLTATGADGKEHPLVRAQTADLVAPGTGKLTLRFDAGYARLTGLEGDYQVRDLMLYSQGVDAPMQRMLTGPNVRFTGVRLADLAAPAHLPPRVLEMQRRGLL